MVERKVESVEPDSPDRCASGHKNGQCIYKKCPGSDFCPMHGGNVGTDRVATASKRAYQLAKWQGQVDAFADEDEAKSLRGEIGITRLLLQQAMNQCKDAGQLMMMSGKIGDLVGKIEKLVTSCHRLEAMNGQLLDKTKVLELASQMISIIGSHVTDEEILSRISDDIVLLVAQSPSSNLKDPK